MTALPSTAIREYEQYLPIHRSSAKRARRFAERILIRWHLDDDHVDDVLLVADELVANAVTHGRGAPPATNVTLKLIIWSKWTLLVVDDRTPEIKEPPADDVLAESGRGLLIVNALAARFWWAPKVESKTANAAVLRTGVKLTADDEAILDQLENGTYGDDEGPEDAL